MMSGDRLLKHGRGKSVPAARKSKAFQRQSGAEFSYRLMASLRQLFQAADKALEPSVEHGEVSAKDAGEVVESLRGWIFSEHWTVGCFGEQFEVFLGRRFD